MQFKDFGILITAYENVEQVLENIRHIRKNFKEINKCQIVVISTTEKDEVKQKFVNLLYTEGLQPLIVKVLDNVPGNPGVSWERPAFETSINWRHRYLGGRIFKSMSHGFNLLYNLDIETGLHIHSDTFLKSTYENELLQEIDSVNSKYLGYWDICIEDTGTNVHIHPEGILWHLPDCKELGILDIFNCFNHCHYKCWNFGSIEALIGTWCNYRQSCQNIGIDERASDKFYEYFKVRCRRPYHGDFEHLINLAGTQ